MLDSSANERMDEVNVKAMRWLRDRVVIFEIVTGFRFVTES